MGECISGWISTLHVEWLWAKGEEALAKGSCLGPY